MRGSGAYCLAAWAVAALGAQEPVRNLQLSTFGTLGLARTDSDLVGFRRDGAQYDGIFTKVTGKLDSRIGVQASSRLTPDLLATVQVLSRERYDGSWKPGIPWATLTWSPAPGLQVRAGVFNFNETPAGDNMEVGHTFLWARPPVEVLGGGMTTVRGVWVAKTFQPWPGATLEASAEYGTLLGRHPVDHVGPWDVTGSPTGGARLVLYTGGWKLIAGVAAAKFSANVPEPVPTIQTLLRGFSGYLHDPRPAQAADALEGRGRTISTTYVCGVWAEGPFEVQGYLGRSITNSFSSPPTWQGYASFGWRLGNLGPYAMAARAEVGAPQVPDLGTLRTVTGPLASQAEYLAYAVDTIARARAANQWTFTTGLRWDFARWGDLKFQVDRLRAPGRGTGNLYVPTQGPPPPWNGRLTVYSVTLDFQFGGGR